MQFSKDFERELLQFGLSLPEIRVYLSLFFFGPLPVSGIARRGHLHRSTVYAVIAKLQESGLVGGFQKGSVQFFVAEDIRRFENICEERIHKQQVLRKRLELIAGRFYNLHDTSFPLGEPRVFCFYGIEGIKSIYFNILTIRQPIFSFLSTENSDSQWERILMDIFEQDRISSKIPLYLLSHNSDQIVSHLCHQEFTNVVFLSPSNLFASAHLLVCGQQVSFVNIERGALHSIRVEYAHFSRLMRGIFYNLWKSAGGQSISHFP